MQQDFNQDDQEQETCCSECINVFVATIINVYTDLIEFIRAEEQMTRHDREWEMIQRQIQQPFQQRQWQTRQQFLQRHQQRQQRQQQLRQRQQQLLQQQFPPRIQMLMREKNIADKINIFTREEELQRLGITKPKKQLQHGEELQDQKSFIKQTIENTIFRLEFVKLISTLLDCFLKTDKILERNGKFQETRFLLIRFVHNLACSLDSNTVKLFIEEITEIENYDNTILNETQKTELFDYLQKAKRDNDDILQQMSYRLNSDDFYIIQNLDFTQDHGILTELETELLNQYNLIQEQRDEIAQNTKQSLESEITNNATNKYFFVKFVKDIGKKIMEQDNYSNNFKNTLQYFKEFKFNGKSFFFMADQNFKYLTKEIKELIESDIANNNENQNTVAAAESLQKDIDELLQPLRTGIDELLESGNEYGKILNSSNDDLDLENFIKEETAILTPEYLDRTTKNNITSRIMKIDLDGLSLEKLDKKLDKNKPTYNEIVLQGQQEVYKKDITDLSNAALDLINFGRNNGYNILKYR